MDGISGVAFAKAIAEYGVLGLGWLAWILTMGYYRKEQERYQNLVIHIIQHFTQINMRDVPSDMIDSQHQPTFSKLFKDK